uniref:Uncharacterized protein n=1 Tax=Arcella intermedia TaxID=1963864 RepID=A0A6B2LLV0_9EUKA
MGPEGVGKSAFTVRFVNGIFVARYDPTIEDCYRINVQVDGKSNLVEVLDTAEYGQPTMMKDLFMKSGEGFILMYSISDQVSLDAMQRYREGIVRAKETEIFPVVLVGNKCDMEAERVVSKEQGEMLAQQFNALFVECSAKTGVNVTQSVKSLLKLIEHDNPNNSKAKQFRGGCHLL